MNFVLDNSVAMRWLLGGNAAEITYASRVLDAFERAAAVVPTLWFLEVANVIVKTEIKLVVTAAQSQQFISTLGH